MEGLKFTKNWHTARDIADITGHEVEIVRKRLKSVKPVYHVDSIPVYRNVDWQQHILPKEYDGYLSVSEIAIMYCTSKTTVSKMLRKSPNVKINWRKSRMYLYAPETVKAALVDPGAGLISIPEAAERVGLEIRAIHRMINRHWKEAPIKSNTRSRIGKRDSNLYKEADLISFLEAYQSSYYTLIDMFCAEFGINYSLFKRLCDNLGVNWRRQLSAENWEMLYACKGKINGEREQSSKGSV